MDECLQMLDERQECANDEILVHLVRFQLINENVHSGGFWHGGIAAMPGPLQASPSFYLHAIQSQLQSLKTKMEPYSQRYRKQGHPAPLLPVFRIPCSYLTYRNSALALLEHRFDTERVRPVQNADNFRRPLFPAAGMSLRVCRLAKVMV